MNYSLRFEMTRIRQLAERYVEQNSDQSAESYIERIVAPAVKRNGFYDRDEFLKVCRWKTPRTQPRCAGNDEDFIQEVTGIALSTGSERLRIEVLRVMAGVDWPTASVLLHFGHSEQYPILDFRALESLSIDMPNQYSFDFWWHYVDICRSLAIEAGVSMRTLDRALWQDSVDKANQETPATSNIA